MLKLKVAPIGDNYRIQDTTTNTVVYEPMDYGLNLPLEQMETLCTCLNDWGEDVYQDGYDKGSDDAVNTDYN